MGRGREGGWGGGGYGGGRAEGVETDRNGQDRAGLARALDGLSREHREALVLCYGRGMSQSEAAGVLRVPLGTVKSRMHAAMGLLREALGDGSGGAA